MTREREQIEYCWYVGDMGKEEEEEDRRFIYHALDKEVADQLIEQLGLARACFTVHRGIMEGFVPYCVDGGQLTPIQESWDYCRVRVPGTSIVTKPLCFKVPKFRCLYPQETRDTIMIYTFRKIREDNRFPGLVIDDEKTIIIRERDDGSYINVVVIEDRFTSEGTRASAFTLKTRETLENLLKKVASRKPGYLEELGKSLGTEGFPGKCAKKILELSREE